MKIEQVISNLKRDGVTLEDVGAELDYREQSNGLTWDDNLYEYSTAELSEIEQNWSAQQNDRNAKPA